MSNCDSKESACNAGDLGSIPSQIPWRRRAWQPTPVFWPGEFHGQRSLVGYSPWGHKDLDTAEQLNKKKFLSPLQIKLNIFSYLLAICISPSINCPLMHSFLFPLGQISFPYQCISVLYILRLSPLPPYTFC